MARFNEILVGRYNNALKKLFSMKGAAPSPQISSEIAPVLSLFSGVELRFLEEWHRFAFRFSVAGVAAQQASARLRNPVGANVIAVLEKITVWGTATDNPLLQLAAQTADYGTLASAARLDPRGRPATGLIVSNSGTGVTMTALEQASFPANGSYDFITYENQEITLLPGDAVQVLSNIVNTNLNGCFLWRERFLEESERQ